jgi:hypothetical protein
MARKSAIGSLVRLKSGNLGIVVGCKEYSTTSFLIIYTCTGLITMRSDDVKNIQKI